MKSPITGAIFGAILGIIGAIISVTVDSEIPVDEVALETEVASQQEKFLEKFDLKALPQKLQIELFEKFSSLTITSATTPSVIDQSQGELKSIVSVELNKLNQRVEIIEDRIPEQSSVDKYASVNDAIFVTKIENLESTVKELREERVTTFEVLTMIFYVLGGLVAIVAFAGYFIKSRRGA